MSHALLTHPEHSLPVIVSMDSRDFAELSMAGYTIIDTGTRKRLETVEEEMMIDFVNDLELNEIT